MREYMTIDLRWWKARDRNSVGVVGGGKLAEAKRPLVAVSPSLWRVSNATEKCMGSGLKWVMAVCGFGLPRRHRGIALFARHKRSNSNLKGDI